MSAFNQLPPFWEMLAGFAGTAALIFLTIWGYRRSDRAEQSVEAKEEYEEALKRAREEGAKEERESNREKRFDEMNKTLESIQRVQQSIWAKSNSIEKQGSETSVLLREHIRNHERRTA